MVTYRHNQAGLRYVLRSRHGPVGRDLARRVYNVEGRAILEAPLGKFIPGDEFGGGHIPGGLKGSIRSYVSETPGGLVGRVVAEVPYAASVHEGSRGHPIAPGGKFLRWRKPPGYSQEVFRRSVVHPGTRRGNPFLSRALKAAER